MPKSKQCRRCGAVSPAGVWLCECGEDLREPGAALAAGERFDARRPTSTLFRVLGPIFCGALVGAGVGLLYAETGSSGFFGRDFDVMIWTPLGALAGGALGIVVGIVLVVAAR